MRLCPDCNTSWPEAHYLTSSRKCRSCRRNIHERWRNTDGGKAHYGRRKASKHGLIVEEYHGMIWLQDNKCKVCEKEMKQVHVDHDHAHCPGEYGCAKCVRGLLCRACNTAIGMMNDDPAALRRAAGYVEGEVHA